MATDNGGVSDRIRLARELSGLTQAQAAEQLGVSTRTWIRWETGKSEGFLDHLDRIAENLGTTPYELTDGGADVLKTLVKRTETMAAELRLLRREVAEGFRKAAL